MNVTPKVFVSKLLAEPWAMDPRRLRDFVGELVAGSTMVDAATIKAAKDSGADPNGAKYSVVDGVARIPIQGVVLKSVPCVFGFFGIEATSTVGTMASINKALADKEVKEIVLDVDSPGGTVAGVQELADLVWQVAQSGEKPISAQISDLSASAAYWIASQASRIDVNESGAVGSIGVYSVIDDVSKAAENAGIKTHVVSSHELKGIGVTGAPVTEAQLADVRRNVLDYAAIFESAVARARGLGASQMKKVATGQVWLGDQAVTMGLVDNVRGVAAKPTVSSRQPTAAANSQPTPDTGDKREDVMSEKEATPVAIPAADEIEKLRAEKAKAEAEAEAARATVAAMKDQQLADLMVKYEARISPKAKDAIEKLGRQMDDSVAFEEYLKALPEVIRPDRQSTDAGMLKRDYAALPPEQDREMAKWLNVDVSHQKRLLAYGKGVKFVRMDGTAVLHDGREVAKDENLAEALGVH